jgi:hypothetical protein
MKNICTPLIAAWLAASVPAWGQTGMPDKPDASAKTPSEPGMRGAPDSSMKAPSNSGIVVAPPKTDPEAVATPPKNVDPGIAAPTKEIDRKNRKESEDKTKVR